MGAHGLQAYFNQRISEDAGEERQDHGRLGRDSASRPATAAVIQSWRGAKALADAAQQGTSRNSFVGLLSGPPEPGELALRQGSAGRTGRANSRRSRRR